MALFVYPLLANFKQFSEKLEASQIFLNTIAPIFDERDIGRALGGGCGHGVMIPPCCQFPYSDLRLRVSRVLKPQRSLVVKIKGNCPRMKYAWVLITFPGRKCRTNPTPVGSPAPLAYCTELKRLEYHQPKYNGGNPISNLCPLIWIDRFEKRDDLFQTGRRFGRITL
jgi:hypothetical protein